MIDNQRSQTAFKNEEKERPTLCGKLRNMMSSPKFAKISIKMNLNGQHKHLMSDASMTSSGLNKDIAG